MAAGSKGSLGDQSGRSWKFSVQGGRHDWPRVLESGIRVARTMRAWTAGGGAGDANHHDLPGVPVSFGQRGVAVLRLAGDDASFTGAAQPAAAAGEYTHARPARRPPGCSALVSTVTVVPVSDSSTSKGSRIAAGAQVDWPRSARCAARPGASPCRNPRWRRACRRTAGIHQHVGAGHAEDLLEI